MAILNIFANFFIDTPERLQRMKDSFTSFSDINAEAWVINCRGEFRNEVIGFLEENLADRLVMFQLNSKEGWFHDTRQMLSSIDSDYVLFWLEDHINLANVKTIDSIITEMKDNSIDYMYYTFWWDGALRQRYQGISMNSGVNIDWFDHTISNNQVIQKNAVEGVFVIAACSIFKNDLFKRIVLADDPVKRRWPPETPFDFEKCPTDLHWLPLKVALPRQELFASIDDDHVHPGSCLISRGLYENREPRQTYAIVNRVSAQEKMRRFAVILSRPLIVMAKYCGLQPGESTTNHKH